MLKRFRSNKAGSAAVEFAFIAPLMILMYCGIAELTQAMMADRRVSHVASSIGDLVAQQSQINQAAMDDVFTIGRAIVAPFATTSLSMRVTSIKADANGNPQVVWSKTSGAGYTVLAGAVAGLPNGLVSANESVVMAESKYTYTSAIQKTVTNPIPLSQKYYLKPRKGTEVIWAN